MGEAQSLNSVSFRSVDIERAGIKLKVGILLVDGQEGVTVQQAAELFGVSYQNIYKHINKYAICSQPLVESITNDLKSLGVIPFRSNRHVRFLSKDALKDLMWVIGTDSAKAAYYQLWNDAEELLRVKPEVDLLRQGIAERDGQILEIAGQLKAALDRSAIDHVKLRMQERKIADLEAQLMDRNQHMAQLEAKLEAASHQISLGGNRKTPKFNLPIYVRQSDDIFKKPSYTIELVKKSIGEMSEAEQKRFALQHSSKVAVGVSGSLIRTMNDLGVDNPMILEKAELLRTAAKNLHSEIMPSDAGLLALNNGYLD